MDAEDITKIIMSKYPEPAPVGNDDQWSIEGSDGLYAYRQGTQVIIYAPSNSNIYAMNDSSYLFSDKDGVTLKEFRRLRNIEGLNNLNTSNVEDASHMFKNCKSLEYVDLSVVDTGSIKDLTGTFESCEALREVNLLGCVTSHREVDANGLPKDVV